MNDMKFGITFEYTQKYLPTKKSDDERARVMVTCRQIPVRRFSKKEEELFPVAVKVTSEGRSDIYRTDGEKLYSQCRLTVNGEPGEPLPLVTIRKHLKPAGVEPIMQEKPYRNGISINTTNDLDLKIEKMRKTASEYVIYDNTAWRVCAWPYYLVRTCEDTKPFDIGWTYDTTLTKPSQYLATEKEEAVQEVLKTADQKVKAFMKNTDNNIEVVLPDAYKLNKNLSSHDNPGYMWDSDKKAYIKAYCPMDASNKWYVTFVHKHGNKHIAIVNARPEFDVLTNLQLVTGTVLADCRNVSFADITDIYDEYNNMSLLGWYNMKKGRADKEGDTLRCL